MIKNKLKIIVAPDKFKHTFSAAEISTIIENSILKNFNDIEVIKIPLSDGGEGFSDIIQTQFNCEKRIISVCNPLFNNINASYYFSKENKIGIIELSNASGLNLLKKKEQNPLKTTNFGTGLLIDNAIKSGAKKIILGLGGSATNDAGIGIASALGFVFLNKFDEILNPIGENLINITKIIKPKTDELKDIKFEIAADVSNILYGKNGAAHTFATQKGASKKDVIILDNGLKNFAEIIKNQFNIDISKIAGGAAAGGVGAGLYALLNAEIKSGIELILKSIDFENLIRNADLIITGEGKIDSQSVSGKVISGVVKMGKNHSIPVTAIAGLIELSEIELNRFGLINSKSLFKSKVSIEIAKEKSVELINKKTIEIITELRSKFLYL